MNDLISRQDAIDVLSVGKEILSRVLDDVDVVGIDREKYSWGLGLIESYINDIKELPSAEPERKRGKWNFIGNQMFECSECGTCYTQSQFYQMRVRISDTEFPKFCPNCGADMREGQDG